MNANSCPETQTLVSFQFDSADQKHDHYSQFDLIASLNDKRMLISTSSFDDR